MLGHMLYLQLKKNKDFEVLDLSYRKKLHPNTILCDVTEDKEIKKIILKLRPNIIINCIGVLLKSAHLNKPRTIYLNAYFPHRLTEFSEKVNARIIHISTDCVFDGKNGLYSEEDIPNPIDLYGKTKSLGEIIENKNLTLRTSIIGPEIKFNGEGLFHWLMKQNSTIKGYTNVFWGGVTTLHLSRVIEKSIILDLKGLIHVTNGKKISKYDLINLINKHFKSESLNKLSTIHQF